MNRRHGLLALCLLTGVPAAHAQAPPDFHVSRASAPPTIDGDLTDEAWLGKPLEMGSWVTYNPLRGETVPTRTEVRIVYDDRNIYFAFHCFDDEPDKIRTTVSRRDSVFNDDWIALSLDSAGTGQTAYHLFVNPSGVQMDALNTSSGERFEADMIWDTAGKVTDDGYVVELRLPLQTVRFSGGDAVRMGLVFFRRISRSGISASWPEMAPGQWVFDRPAHLVFGNLKQPPLIELLPSVTYGVTPDTRHGGSMGRRGQERRLRHEREVRHHVQHHAGRDRQSRLQPGRKRCLPGGSQPAFPGLLLREAAVLHGRHGALRPCGNGRGQQHADGRAYPPDHQSRLGQQGHGHAGPGDIRPPQLAGRQSAGS